MRMTDRLGLPGYLVPVLGLTRVRQLRGVVEKVGAFVTGWRAVRPQGVCADSLRQESVDDFAVVGPCILFDPLLDPLLDVCELFGFPKLFRATINTAIVVGEEPRWLKVFVLPA